MKRQKQVSLILWVCLVAVSSSVFGQLEQVVTHFKEIQDQSNDSPQTISFIQEEDQLVADFSKLSQIVLIRHGEPALYHKGRRSRIEAMEYIQRYDSVGIFTPHFIPFVIEPDELKVIHTSSINRAVSTAEQVFHRVDLQDPDPMYREFERKIFPFPNLRLPLKVWLYGSRLLWFIGLNDSGIESKKEAKERALKGAKTLALDAQTNGKTVLVSHGLLNRYLEDYLQDLGWVTVYDGGDGYLSQKMLVRYE